jgi:hypothetical protein
VKKKFSRKNTVFEEFITNQQEDEHSQLTKIFQLLPNWYCHIRRTNSGLATKFRFNDIIARNEAKQ